MHSATSHPRVEEERRERNHRTLQAATEETGGRESGSCCPRPTSARAPAAEYSRGAAFEEATPQHACGWVLFNAISSVLLGVL